MKNLTIILPYYMNGGMLQEQIRTFNTYPQDVQEKLELIVVDDCSPLGNRAIDYVQILDNKPKGYDFKLYRILTDLRWNWLECRNLGAQEASSSWILLTDIDHIIPIKTMALLMKTEMDPRSFYTFPRINWKDNSAYHPHPNSYLMTKKLYWRIGGYDESFAGHYGTDGMWRRRCEELAAHVFLTDCPLARVSRDDIPDASTRPEILARKQNRDPEALDDIREYKEALGVGIQTLRLPWKRIL